VTCRIQQPSNTRLLITAYRTALTLYSLLSPMTLQPEHTTLSHPHRNHFEHENGGSMFPKTPVFTFMMPKPRRRQSEFTRGISLIWGDKQKKKTWFPVSIIKCTLVYSDKPRTYSLQNLVLLKRLPPYAHLWIISWRCTRFCMNLTFTGPCTVIYFCSKTN